MYDEYFAQRATCIWQLATDNKGGWWGPERNYREGRTSIYLILIIIIIITTSRIMKTGLVVSPSWRWWWKLLLRSCVQARNFNQWPKDLAGPTLWLHNRRSGADCVGVVCPSGWCICCRDTQVAAPFPVSWKTFFVCIELSIFANRLPTVFCQKQQPLCGTLSSASS